MSDGGKGDGRRPCEIPMREFDNNWDAIDFSAILREAAEREAAKQNKDEKN